MRSWISAGVLAFILGSAILNLPHRIPGSVVRSGESTVVSVDPNDPELLAAMQEARETYDTFLKELDKPGKREFMVKLAMRTRGGGLEHIWAAEVKKRNGKVVGVVDSEPYEDIRLKQGDFVVIREKEVTDWLVFDPKTEEAMGGYTIPVIEKRMRE